MISLLWQQLFRWLAIGIVAALVLDGLAMSAFAGTEGDGGFDGEAANDAWADRSAAPGEVQQPAPVATMQDDDDDDDDDVCEIELEAGAAAGSDGYCADQVITRLIPGIDANAVNADFGTETIAVIEGRSLYLLRLPENSEETDFAARLERDDRVRWAELNFIDQAPEGSPRRFYLRANDAVPVASDLDRAYAPELVGAPSALACVSGSGVTVAVIDSGFDPDHPAFADTPMDAKDAWNAFSDQDGFGNVDDIGNSEDDDGDGLIDEMTGHGTHVSGIIVQVAPGAALMPIKALDSDGIGQAFYLARAIYRALDRNADVINLSLGSTADTRVVREATGDATDAGIFVAAAAGNSGPQGPREYPATLDRVFGVAATDAQDRPAEFSSVHASLDLSAPGDGIVSAFALDQPPSNPLGSPYALWSGTSMATPWVAGAAALLMEQNPGWSANQVAARLRDTAAPIQGSATGMGSGRLDVAAAVGCEQGASARDGQDTGKEKAKKGKKGKQGKGKKGKNRR